MVKLSPIPVFGAKKVPVPFDGIFHRNFRTNGKSRIESNSQSINWSDSKNRIFNDNYLYFGTTEM